MADISTDVAIIGAGIAGASAAFEIAAFASVTLLERESQPGYHSTGRSAALYTETYGNPAIRALTIASRRTLAQPAADLGEQSFLSPRGTLWIGRPDERGLLDEALGNARALVPDIQIIGPDEARQLCPVLRPGYLAAALWEQGAMDIDVHALQQAYLRGFSRRGGRMLKGADVTAATRTGGYWQLRAGGFAVQARTLVNAAGAWADVVAQLAGVSPLGILPARRTAFTFDAPPDVSPAAWPCVIGVAEDFYFKPEAGRLLGSPADETPQQPSDAQPDDMDVAVAVERIERATTINIQRVRHSWAGLRCFAPDRSPVIGRDAGAQEYYWLAGQGGYGIMTSPAAATAIASLVAGQGIPRELAELGISAASLAPDRLRLR